MANSVRPVANGVRSVPTTFYVDPDGVLQKSHVGVVTRMQLASWVD